jgi:hypothetical protein
MLSGEWKNTQRVYFCIQYLGSRYVNGTTKLCPESVIYNGMDGSILLNLTYGGALRN